MYKVLFIAHCRCMYGANKSLLNLMLDLRERYQIKPYVILPIEVDGEFAEILESYQIPYFVCPYKRWIEGLNVSFKCLRLVKKVIGNQRSYRELYTKIKDLGIDLVHSNSSTIQIGAWLAKQLNVPHVWHIREFGQEDYEVQIIYPKWIVQRFFNQADVVIAISKAIEDKYRNEVCPDANIETVYNGIANDTMPRIHDTVIQKQRIQFVCVGVLLEQKGQMDILKACTILKEQGYQNYEVIFVGTGTEEYEKVLKDYVNTHGLEQQVQFLGYRTDVKSILQNCDIGIVASEKEAFGRVTVEYMFATLPVIGTESGGTPEIISNGEQGYLYEVHNEQHLAQCMLVFIEKPEKIVQMGRCAYKKAQEKFSMHANTDNIYKLYCTRMKNRNE